MCGSLCVLCKCSAAELHTLQSSLFKNIFVMSMYVHHVHTVPKEVRRGRQTSWNWSHGQLLATMTQNLSKWGLTDTDFRSGKPLG